jgi:hypothetical protein
MNRTNEEARELFGSLWKIAESASARLFQAEDLKAGEALLILERDVVLKAPPGEARLLAERIFSAGKIDFETWFANVYSKRPERRLSRERLARYCRRWLCGMSAGRTHPAQDTAVRFIASGEAAQMEFREKPWAYRLARLESELP